MNNQAWAIFLDQFDKVRLKSEADAEMFGARFNRDGDFRLEVRSLKHIVDEIDASFHHSKIAVETSELARDAWLEYEDQWRDLIEYANAHFSEGFDQETWGFWMEGAPNIRKNGHLYSGLEDYSSGEHFDPKVHNGGQLIEFARNEFRKFSNLKEKNELDNLDREIFQDIRNVFHVLTDLEDKIGADLTRAFRLWAKIPPYLLPKPEGSANDDFIIGFYEVLRDAIRAYVLGSKLSALTMCRALMEGILKRYYIQDHREIANRKGQGEGDLRAIISEAALRYEFLDRQLMHDIRRKANDVLHDTADITIRSKQLDDEIFKYFEGLRTMIERAPRVSE